jgi:hypothetical protein
MSFLNGVPVPEWLSAAFIERYRMGQQGEIRSWDEVFGKPTRYGAGKRLRRRMEEESLILEEVERIKAEGKPLNEEEFHEIGRRLKGVSAGKTKVKELLRDAKLWAERMSILYRGH